MSGVAEFLAWLVADTFASSLVALRRSRAAARSFAAEGRVTSGIRAVEGRVENIGTEWSAGVAEIAPGHSRFSPRMGIVGTRDIAVVDARSRAIAPYAAPRSAPSTRSRSRVGEGAACLFGNVVAPDERAVTIHISAQAAKLLVAVPEAGP